MSELQIEYWDMDRIKPYHQNPRKNDQTVQKLAELYRKYGVRQPITVDSDGVIITGHSRYFAGRQEKMKRFPIIVAHDMDPALVRSYRLDDNKVQEYSDWNYDMLAEEMKGLKDMEIDLTSLMFTAMELAVVTAEIPDPLEHSYVPKTPIPNGKKDKPKPPPAKPAPQLFQAPVAQTSQPEETKSGKHVHTIATPMPELGTGGHVPPVPFTPHKSEPKEVRMTEIKLDLSVQESNTLNRIMPHLKKEFGTNSITRLILECMEYAYNTTGGVD